MQIRDIPVVILCGGLGTRLREETETRPKPMVEIGNAPILWHIMKIYGHYGFRRFVLCLGYKGHVIKDFFLNYDSWQRDITVEFGSGGGVIHHTASRDDWQVTLAETGPETMTGGRIYLIERYIDQDVFMATYGDGLADVDLVEQLAFHRAHGKIGTVTAMNPRSRFGTLDLDDEGNVLRFREKPKMDNWVNGGFYVFHRRIFEYLDPECILERDPLERLSKDGELAAFRHVRSWDTMDTHRDYQLLNELWNSNRAGWKIWKD